MITTNRCVLVVTNTGLKSEMLKFEAIEEASSIEEAKTVWGNNKTPVIDKDALPVNASYSLLEVTEDMTISDFVEFCHENGFECGEYSTGEVYDTNDDDCFLCRIGNLGGSNRPLRIYNKTVEREADVILYESPHFFVVSEYGSILRGFLMICPKEHILSMAELPDGYFAEYYQTQKDIEFILKQTFGTEKPVSFFEHGSDPSGKSSHKRSVVHAHTHVVWGFELEEKYRNMICLTPCDDIKTARGGKYFSYQNGVDGQLMIGNNPDVYIQRQFPRQVMAETLGLAPGQYNWRNEGFEENVTATLYRIHRFLANNSNSLPERIARNTAGFVKGYPLRDGYRKA